MQTGRRRLIISGCVAFIMLCLLSSAQTQVPKPTPGAGQDKRLPSTEIPRTVSLSQQCQATRERGVALRSEMETSLSPQVKAAAEQYAAKPGPGISSEKAWGDYAAAASLTGGAPVAAWAGLKAAATRWNGETVANTGIYLYQLGKTQDALQFLSCAYEVGYRSPYLFEALAVVHQASGNNAQARQFINQALAAAPDDVLIETEASFINTGQPPPSRPPQSDPDGLDEALRELEEHAQRALALIKAQADAIDQSIPDAKARQSQQISADYINKLIPIVRDQIRDARAANAATRQIMINTTLSSCISSYAEVTDQLLSFLDTTETNGSPLLLWSDVLGLDPPVLHREQEDDGKVPERWAMQGGGPALSHPAHTQYFRALEAARRESTTRSYACQADNACLIREKARFCGIWKQLYEVWENASRQRHNTAARAFDRIATRKVIEAENEYLQLRDYAVRQLKKMRFPPASATPGFSWEETTLKGINATIKTLYDRHLSSASDTSSGMVSYLRERARWFDGERKGMDETLAQQAEEIQRECEPAIRALLELLAQEEWQAYLDHLKDRLAWDIQPKTESEFPCEGTIGPLTIETDLNKPGEGKFDLKWKGKSFQGGGNVTVGPGGITGGGGLGRRTTSGVSVATAGASGPGFGQSVSYGPFQGKGKVSFTSKVSPWDSREYLGIKLKGSAGLGLSTRKGQLGLKCYPSSGSVTIYPRALYDDAVRYLSTPASPPRGGSRPR